MNLMNEIAREIFHGLPICNHFVNPDGAGSWAAESNGTYQWLQVDLVILNTRVTRMATQGSNRQQGEWVTKYNLQCGNDTERFHNYTAPGQNTTKVKLISCVLILV